MDEVTIRAFQPGDEVAVAAIMWHALEAGELTGTTRRDIERMLERLPIAPEDKFISISNGQVTGILAPGWEFLAVHPTHRRRGHATRLVTRALAWTAEQGRAYLELAVPPGNAGALACAQALGFHYHSSLWLMELDPVTQVVPPTFPAGFSTRTLQRGDDEPQFVELFNAAFASHPSPITLSLDAVRHVHALPHFDPATILLVFAPGVIDPIAFSRVEFPESPGAQGEIDFIGVLPAYRGIGLGRDLLRQGVATLRDRGAGTITLNVEARNTNALALYERNGFRRAQEWPRWAKAVP
jgi:mycothiol synthase